MYILDTATDKGKCRKLSPSWKGPGIVVKKLSPYLYRVKTKAAVMVANHDRLRKCVDRDIPLCAVTLQREVPESYARGGGHSRFPAQGRGRTPAPLIRLPWVLSTPGNTGSCSPAQAQEGPPS